MPNTLEELAEMLAQRDGISLEDAWRMIDVTIEDIEYALFENSYTGVEEALMSNLGIEPDYLDLFF